jgi:excisionase family DNA binding protein
MKIAAPEAAPLPALAMSVETFAKSHGIGRTIAYREIAAGRLRAAKVGKRTLITAEAAADWRALISQRPAAA